MNIKLSQVAVLLPQARFPLFQIPSLEISPGSQVLVYGPSGRGKTTLLHLIAGLMDPSEGYVFLGKDNLRFLSDEERSRLRRHAISMVFQKLNLLDHLTALENVLLTLPKGRDHKEEAFQALKTLGVEKLADVFTGNLSLGEQQRIAVARVLASRPKIVLADEPTSSLDAANAGIVADALLSLPGNPTVVFVSHDERLRHRFSTRYDFEEWVK